MPLASLKFITQQEQYISCKKLHIMNIINTKFTLLFFVIFSPLMGQEKDIVSDIDENVYQTVKIGHQWWMAENLTTTKYADGSPIPDGTGHGNINNESNPEYWFAYEGDLNNVSAHGRLYTYYVTASEKNVCPDGWHVATDEDWKELVGYATNNGYAGQEGVALKADYAWILGAGVDAFGFEAIPSGFRGSLGQYIQKGSNAYFWTSSGFDGTSAWRYSLSYNSPSVSRFNDIKKSAFSVRCVADEGTTGIDNQNNLGVDIFPTLTRNYVQISGLNYRSMDVMIIDMNGRLHLSLKLYQVDNFQIDLSGLPNGFYIVHINNGYKVKTHKIIKN